MGGRELKQYCPLDEAALEMFEFALADRKDGAGLIRRMSKGIIPSHDLPLMKKRLIRMSFALVIGLGMLAGGVWVLSRALADRVVVYQGKRIYYWAERLNDSDAAASNQANAVVAREIIPRLTKAMFSDTNDSSLRMALVEQLNVLPGIQVYCTPAAGRRAYAASELGELGPAAKAAVPALLQALSGHDQPVRGAATVALGKIHCQPEVVIPLLIGLLDDKELKDEAAQALGGFGGLSKAAVPKLIPLLKIQDKELHAAVIQALRKIDPAAAVEAGVK